MSYRKPTPDPSITIPLTGGSISITAAGPVALIRAYTEGREQVVLRATIEQLAELVDAAIADDVGVSSVAIGKRRAAMGLASNFRGSAPLVERAA